MLGGSSGVNHMMSLYPSRAIMDAWGDLGNTGWSFDDIVPYFRRFAKTHAPSETSGARGYYDASISAAETGAVHLLHNDYPNALSDAWLAAFDKLGLRAKKDPRLGGTVGAFENVASVDPSTMTRSYAVTAYLQDDVRTRSNLIVMTNTLVSRIVFDEPDGSGEPVASGVEVRTATGDILTIRARREVIVAAGTLHSCQILELSGIGNKVLLEQHGIPVVVDNASVGERIQDHPIVSLSFQVTEDAPSLDVLRDPALVAAAMARYASTRDGVMAETIRSNAYLPLMDVSGPASAESAADFCAEFLQRPAAGGDDKAASPDELAILRRLIATQQPVLQAAILPAQVCVPDRPASLLDHMAHSCSSSHGETAARLEATLRLMKG